MSRVIVVSTDPRKAHKFAQRINAHHFADDLPLLADWDGLTPFEDNTIATTLAWPSWPPADGPEVDVIVFDLVKNVVTPINCVDATGLPD